MMATPVSSTDTPLLVAGTSVAATVVHSGEASTSVGASVTGAGAGTSTTTGEYSIFVGLFKGMLSGCGLKGSV